MPNIWHICIGREHAYKFLFAVITLRLSLQFRHKVILTCLQLLIDIFISLFKSFICQKQTTGLLGFILSLI